MLKTLITDLISTYIVIIIINKIVINNFGLGAVVGVEQFIGFEGVISVGAIVRVEVVISEEAVIRVKAVNGSEVVIRIEAVSGVEAVSSGEAVIDSNAFSKRTISATAPNWSIYMMISSSYFNISSQTPRASMMFSYQIITTINRTSAII
jgi:hypothetical protein